jgi:hypothetical protein
MRENYMTFDLFKRIVEMYCGFSRDDLEINMTPVLGEVFLDPDILNKMTYLENNINVKEYFIVTNFLRLPTEFFEKLPSFEKFNLLISVYGDSAGSFYEITQRDMFNTFFNNLKELSKTQIKRVELLLRGDFSLPPYTSIFKTTKMIENNNIAGLIPIGSNENEVEMPYKSGLCMNALYNSITADGNVCICDNADYRYTGKDSIIGNIFKQKLSDIYDIDTKFSDIITKQNMRKYPDYCQVCNEYEPIRQRELYDIMKTITWLEILV